MKFLIWTVCLIVFAIVCPFAIDLVIGEGGAPGDSTALTEGLISGLVTLCLFALTFLAARSICKAWDFSRINTKFQSIASNIPDAVLQGCQNCKKDELQLKKYLISNVRSGTITQADSQILFQWCVALWEKEK